MLLNPVSHRFAQSLHLTPQPPPPFQQTIQKTLPQTQTDLLSSSSLALQDSLQAFRPLNDQYAQVLYADAFNWADIELDEDLEDEWYCVAFRSKRNRAGLNDESLYLADALAHEEAQKGGGLLLYWYGVPNPSSGVNLATCIWQSRDHARAANSRPEHVKAMRLAAQSYEMYTLERHVLRKVAGERGVRVEPFVDR